MHKNIRIGLTHYHDCSYLPERQERVAIVMDEKLHCPEQYEMLLSNGFRRSGSTIYRPYCGLCQACQAVRIPVNDFQPSRSQKRLKNKASQLTWEMKPALDKQWYPLYERYIEQRHQNGSMYPPNQTEFETFSSCSWLTTSYIHIYDRGRLVAVAVTDMLPDSGSAFYTFYDPDSHLSLGTYAVLLQIKICQTMNKQWLYLGYQIDECPAMNYKTRFHPHQRLVNQRWHR
ncbi:arginyl-tRNA-protein transferase [Vibrio aerogenes CECT 7868]|uniref:Aspartate/glutamate leucyltransferase n=1 Tax=Vibrio aerogenes CECT 7868 TaxID=1216006 RepID=A0A1M6EIC9_9VIBR|nr:arginyltransferase [Vibrio aerogenes]SHI85070.1 arginyl-tRNA-protein transferase [Vibrio aerogenes CECT 7868]